MDNSKEAGIEITPAQNLDTPTDDDAVDPVDNTETVSVRMPWRRLSLVIIAIGTLAFGVTAYSFKTGLSLAERYSPLIDAAMEVKLEATTAHLWFEEIIANDRAEDYDGVRHHLERAEWFAHAMLDGGTNEEGTFIPLDAPDLRQNMQDVLSLLTQFSQLMDMRWRARLSLNPNTPYDHEFDVVFASLIEGADQIETKLQHIHAEALKTFKTTEIVLGALTVFATLSIALVFAHFAREQNRSLSELKNEIEQRTLAEKTLRRQATTDTLTNLFNRRHITDLINQEIKRAGRRDTPFCLILFDLDHFKTINDQFGHDTGDRVLQTVAETIRERLRELDAFSRWGGEEFLILVRETKLPGAMALAETCRRRLAQTDMGDIGHITASFGVAEHVEGETVRELVHRADQVLYAAKNAGRNRVMGAKA